MQNTTNIPWNDGEGAIQASYAGVGDGPLRLSSSVVNEGEDRTQIIQVASSASPLSVEVTVKQPGLRERLHTSDPGDPSFACSDGEPFLVLKP